LGTWGRDDWTQNKATGAYTGAATAVGDATLYDLAKDITGNGNLWGDLFKNGNNPNITLINATTGEVADGTKINISELLTDLQGSIQSAIVNAASSPNLLVNCGFPAGTNAPTTTGSYALNEMQAEQINSLFESPGPSPRPHYKCNDMVQIIYAEGVMKGAELSDCQWDDLSIYPASFWAGSNLCPAQPANMPLCKLKRGDWVEFDNHPDLGGWWGAENVIVIEPHKLGEPSTGEYFGWARSIHTYAEWLCILQEVYEDSVPRILQESGSPPMYQGKSWSINVPAVAMMIFDMRTTNKTPHGIGI
jgi:hypothetical protein